MDPQNPVMYIQQSAEPYCILCRRTLPTLRDNHVQAVPRDCMPWETAILGFVDIRVSPSGAPRIFTFKANLNRKQYGRRGMFSSFQPTFNLISRKGKRGKKIQKKLDVLAFYPPGHRLVFFIHRTCWKLAQTLRPKLSGADLYDFALKLREAIPRYCWDTPNCWEASDPWQLVSFSNGNDIRNSDLESWLSKCAQLPIELQLRILSHVHTDDKLTFSLLAAVKTLSLLDVFSSVLPAHGPSVQSLIPDSNTAVVYLYASFIQLFGLNYMHHVRILDKPLAHDDWNHQHIEFNISMVCKVEFIVGLMGILAVRFYFRDGSNSSWLGSAGKGWRCGPLDIHPQDIALFNSDHRNIFEELAKFLSRHLDSDIHSKDLPFQPFWDITQDLPKSGESFMAMPEREFHLKLKYFPVQAMCKYLPLRKNGCHIKGMTVYTSRQGTCGIVLHWKGSDLAVPSSQQRRGTPTSFYFLEGEEIIAVSLVVYGYNVSPIGPYLMFKTNLQRFAYFGPRLRLSDSSTRYMSLIPDRLEQRCAIMGLIVDQNGVTNGDLKNIGVHCQPRENSSTAEEMMSSPKLQFSLLTQKKEFIRSHFGYTRDDTNITTANLTNIKQLRVQRRPFDELAQTGLRCTGMLIHHTDESIETLGSWDGSSTTPSEIIYDSETDGHLKRLTFHLTIDRTQQQYSTPYAYYMCSIVAVSTIGGFAKESKELQESEEHQELLWGRSVVTEQIINYEISSDKPPIAWCFDETIDIIETRSTEMETFKLERYGITPSGKYRMDIDRYRTELRRVQ